MHPSLSKFHVKTLIIILISLCLFSFFKIQLVIRIIPIDTCLVYLELYNFLIYYLINYFIFSSLIFIFSYFLGFRLKINTILIVFLSQLVIEYFFLNYQLEINNELAKETVNRHMGIKEYSSVLSYLRNHVGIFNWMLFRLYDIMTLCIFYIFYRFIFDVKIKKSIAKENKNSTIIDN